MSVVQPLHSTRHRDSFAEVADIEEFVSTLERYESGQLTPDQWRAFRLVRGTYGQRQTADAQMLRVKIPQGILDGGQLNALAEVAERWSRGFGHVTTRQNVQFHFVKLHDVEPAMRRLAESGLTTREACGNSVRNITACPYAGVSADELFDVTAYAEALTRFLLRHPLSSTLPRKFKVAFEGCSEDHAYAAINDIGWRARIRDGVRGFRVTVGGGTAILPVSGQLLFEFLPAQQMFAVAEAILRVFKRLGDYKHKQRNRMKFLIRSMGFAAWRGEVEQELEQVRREGVPALPFDPADSPVETAPGRNRPPAPAVADAAARATAGRVKGPGFVPEVKPRLMVGTGAYARWFSSNVRPQKQEGYVLVVVTLPLGDVTGAQLRLLAELAAAHGDGSVRTTVDQNLFLRWVRREDVPELYQGLAAAGLAADGAGTLADVTSCPGAESCRLAVTQSRGLGRLLGEHLRGRPDLVESVPGLDVKISGCPNGCGQHHVAGIGFQGSVRRLGSKVIPQYFVMLGGGVGEDGARFGRLAAKIPSRRLPLAVERLLALYRSSCQPGETARAFFQRVPLDQAKAALAGLEQISAQDAQPSDYVDLGDDAEFRVETLDGECSA